MRLFTKSLALLLAAAPFSAAAAEQSSGVLGEGKLKNVGQTIYGGQPRPLEDVVAGVIQTFLGIMGVLFLGLTIYGGYLWMTARGNEQLVEKAKETIKNGVIGLAIVLGAYSITTFVTTYLIKAVKF